MNVFFENDKYNHATGSKSFRVISLLIILLFAIVPNALFVQNIDADRLYTARQQGVDGEQNSGNGDIPDDSNKTKNVKESKILNPSVSQVSRLTTHTATLDPHVCIRYDSLTREITISCKSTNFAQVYEILNDPKILKKEGDGIWLLNANLTVSDGAGFTINSNDTKWLKINSTASDGAYQIRVVGSMKVDSVRISSWNTTSNNYTATDGIIPRASIAVVPEATGKVDFTNSEISYLGYDASLRQGLAYLKANGGIIKNNAIHHLWQGLDSRGLSNMVIEDNDIYANGKNGLNPRTGSHDLTIRHNLVHGNEGLGIICSLDCKNITIEGNEIFGNKIGGVMLSRNAVDSVVANNTVYDEVIGIIISESHRDKVYNNVVSNSDLGIEVKSNSSLNKVYNNSIVNPATYGIRLVKGANENSVADNDIATPVKYGICVYNKAVKNQIIENNILNSSKHGICVHNEASDNIVKNNSINGAEGYGIQITDANVKNNTFYGNAINLTKMGISVDNNTDSVFTQNNISSATDSAYSATGNSVLKLHNTTFLSDKISSSGGDNNTIMVADSGIILVKNSTTVGNGTSYDTSKTVYSTRLQDPDLIILRTAK